MKEDQTNTLQQLLDLVDSSGFGWRVMMPFGRNHQKQHPNGIGGGTVTWTFAAPAHV